MKAHLYEAELHGRDCIAASYNNNCGEFVTIPHDKSGLYFQHVGQGKVIYEKSCTDIPNTINGEFSLSEFDIGSVIKGVWRPGLVVDVPQALEVDPEQLRRAKRDLKILIDRLSEITLFVEPDENGLKAFGHKIRELLILACTEVESSWISYFRIAGESGGRLTTKDYVKLNEKLRLFEYKVTFNSHPFHIPMKPFEGWDVSSPTQTISWYNSYNKTKHDKGGSFSEATLHSCLNAIAANIVMFVVRYGPFELIESNDSCANAVAEFFQIELENPSLAHFYVPSLKSYKTATGAFIAPLASGFEKNWEILPLKL